VYWLAAVRGRRRGASGSFRACIEIVRTGEGRTQSAAQGFLDPWLRLPQPFQDRCGLLSGWGERAGRWTQKRRRPIRESRVQGTRTWRRHLAQSQAKPRVLVCASAVGFYGNRGEEILQEESPVGQGFLPEVCREWEDAKPIAAEEGIRTVNIRLGLVLSAKGGALASMLKLVSDWVSADGSDRAQWWSWIHGTTL